MKKINFIEYEINYKNKVFKVLMPEHPIHQLWISPDVDDKTYWDGNRLAFETLLTASAIMATHKNIIIYFPLRKTIYKKYWDREDYDMVWMNNQDYISLSRFKNIIHTVIKKNKRRLFEYDFQHLMKESLSFHYIEHQEYKYNLCPFETIMKSTIFYRLPLFFYKNIFIDLKSYLDQDLEELWKNDILKNTNDVKYAVPIVWLGSDFYHKQKLYFFEVELGFHDVNLANKQLENQRM